MDGREPRRVTRKVRKSPVRELLVEAREVVQPDLSLLYSERDRRARGRSDDEPLPDSARQMLEEMNQEITDETPRGNRLLRNIGRAVLGPFWQSEPEEK